MSLSQQQCFPAVQAHFPSQLCFHLSLSLPYWKASPCHRQKLATNVGHWQQCCTLARHSLSLQCVIEAPSVAAKGGPGILTKLSQ